MDREGLKFLGEINDRRYDQRSLYIAFYERHINIIT